LTNTSPKVRHFTSQLIPAHEIRDVIAKYDPKYMAASLDEAYLNMTSYIQENNLDPTEAITQLRAEIFEKTKITTSAGLGASNPLPLKTNIDTLLAKIGSNKNKVQLSGNLLI
jgi:DNA polymerase kappa